MKVFYKRVICADGFEMSVQAHKGGYCTPRTSQCQRYTAVEVGYPSQKESLLIEYADEPEAPTDTVYGYVPSQRVALVIAKHGGMVSGTVPNGVAPLKAANYANRSMTNGGVRKDV